MKVVIHFTQDFRSRSVKILESIRRFYGGCRKPHDSFHFGIIRRKRCGITVRTDPELCVAVDGYDGPDAITSKPDQNVAHGLRLGFGEGERSAVSCRTGVSRAADAAEIGVEIAIRVHADAAGSAVDFAILSPQSILKLKVK